MSDHNERACVKCGSMLHHESECDSNVITFAEHKERTAKDCEDVAGWITSLAQKVRAGNMDAFERFWVEGGTEEGDAKIVEIRERIVLRYFARKEAPENKTP